MKNLPAYVRGTTHKDWLYDGYPCSAAQWAALDWQRAFMDMGPSPSGNLGPYWHVPHSDGDTAHRLYPKLLQTKWLNVVRAAIFLAAEKARTTPPRHRTEGDR